MSCRRPRFLAALACATASLLTGAAWGAPCGRPDVDLTFPPSDASDVPSNAQLSAHYASPALYDDEPVSLLDPNGDEVAVSVSYDMAESMLRVSPEQLLSSGLHQLTWPALRSVSSGGVGRGSTTSFTVRDAEDTESPRFAGLSAIDWDLSRDRDPCIDGLEDRFVFELNLGPASDDGGAELLSVLVFETREPGSPSRTEPSRVALRALPDGGKLQVRRPADKAGKTCFAAVVQDLLGNVSGGGEVEVCARTKRPPFFDGCALSRTAPGAASPVNGSAWLCLLLAMGLRRRGSRAGSHPARALA